MLGRFVMKHENFGVTKKCENSSYELGAVTSRSAMEFSVEWDHLQCNLMSVGPPRPRNLIIALPHIPLYR
jgi:hypothetical protein